MRWSTYDYFKQLLYWDYIHLLRYKIAHNVIEHTVHIAHPWLQLSVAHKACLSLLFGAFFPLRWLSITINISKGFFKHTQKYLVLSFHLFNPLHKSGTWLWFISGLTHILSFFFFFPIKSMRDQQHKRWKDFINMFSSSKKLLQFLFQLCWVFISWS